MIWLKIIPWRFLVRRMARAQGFLDPFALLARLQRFSQPSEVLAPIELLKAGAVLQARGLMNSQAIQHNLDWVWPFWVDRQYNPRDVSFIPRAFNLAHINLTHRNWTAVGLPSFSEFPVVDPRGLVTPFLDGWSIDAWLVRRQGPSLIPSRLPEAGQELLFSDEQGLSVRTHSLNGRDTLESQVRVMLDGQIPYCQIRWKCRVDEAASLVLSLRPCNPEGVSFIHRIERLRGREGFRINGRDTVILEKAPGAYHFSEYRRGDVVDALDKPEGPQGVRCSVGMATAAASYPVPAQGEAEAEIRVPLLSRKNGTLPSGPVFFESWPKSLTGACHVRVPDPRFQFLYDTALKTLVLLSGGGTVYPGPFTYRRFWFRDAAFILHGLLCAGLADRAERVMDHFPSRQTPFGYFLSQEGEWDSNGEAIWIMHRFGQLTGRSPKPAWRKSSGRAAHWILRKRITAFSGSRFAGLMPAGFSAEHLGPNDYYYWDNFWSVAGLQSAAAMAQACGDAREAKTFHLAAGEYLECVEKSLEVDAKRLDTPAMPASPNRRLDAGAVGSLAAGYPLKLWDGRDARLTQTADFLMRKYFALGGFFQEISHSGVNPYLTLHVAQVLLRAGDPRFFDLVEHIAALASPTGQWPEAIHPRTGGGCMGDGQHVWAAAEWVLAMRHLFIREEEAERKLILFPGIPASWCQEGKTLSIGPAPTSFGTMDLNISFESGREARLVWTADWRGAPPAMEIRLPNRPPVPVPLDRPSFTFSL